jgi:hypothetical protein
MMVCRNRHILDYEFYVLYRTGMQLRLQKKKTQYAAPKLTELPSDKAKILLMQQAAHGDENAKEILNLLRQTSA